MKANILKAIAILSLSLGTLSTAQAKTVLPADLDARQVYLDRAIASLEALRDQDNIDFNYVEPDSVDHFVRDDSLVACEKYVSISTVVKQSDLSVEIKDTEFDY